MNLLTYTIQKHARGSSCPLFTGQFLRAHPLGSSTEASPDNILLLHKRQNHSHSALDCGLSPNPAVKSAALRDSVRLISLIQQGIYENI